MASEQKMHRSLNASDVILSVFWCGTSGRLCVPATQIELFAQLCTAVDISNTDDIKSLLTNNSSVTHLKMAFDGCGVTHGLLGMIFGAGLESQCKVVYNRVLEILAIHPGHLTLNLLGLSRGAIACLKLAQKFRGLSFIDQNGTSSRLHINMLAFDPVPGNAITTSRCDWFGISHATSNMDMTNIDVLNHVLLLYPHEPLPDTAFHAPLIPNFSSTTHVVTEVILGCHQGAMWNHGMRDAPLDASLSAALIINFLCSHGTQLDMNIVRLFFSDHPETLLQRLVEENLHETPTTRSTHSQFYNKRIQRCINAPYLNKTHFLLEQESKQATLNTPWHQKPYLFANQDGLPTLFSLDIVSSPSWLWPSSSDH